MPVDELLSGQSIVCTATYTTTLDDVKAQQVFNQACVNATETGPECDEVDVPYADIKITKTADVDFYSMVGDVINYTVVAQSMGTAALTDVDISDSLSAVLDSWTCDPTTPVDELAPGAKITCKGAYTIVAADIDNGTVENAACVTSNETAKTCDEVETPYAELSITKEASTSSYSAVGDMIGYTITATNTGVAELNNVNITDALISGLSDWSCVPGNPVATLASGESIVCTATYEIDQADIDTGTVFNQACVKSDEVGGGDFQPTVDVPAPGTICADVTTHVITVDLEKSVTPPALPFPGGTFTYTLDIHNTSIVPVTITSLSDTYELDSPDYAANCGTLVGTVLAADDGAPGGADEVSCTYTVDHWSTQPTHANTAIVTVVDVEGTKATDKDEEVVETPLYTGELETTLTKTPSVTQAVLDGTEVTFTLVYSHDEDSVPIYLKSLTDTIYGDLLDAANPDVTDNTCAGAYGTVLLPFTDYECQFTAVVNGDPENPHVNTATVEVTNLDPQNPPPGVEEVTATAEATATVGFFIPSPTEEPSQKPKESQKPTDMLLATDTIGAVDDGNGSGGIMSWAIWVLLSALLILGSGWVIRRQRFAEVKNR